jgi:3-isopropylmalate/(R)-2-methylmalate dehydratase small subunit
LLEETPTVEKFTVHTGVAAPLRRSDVDTDQIIPAEYLKRVTRTGFEDGLFNAWRADPSFVLNDPAYAKASILVAGSRFGVGSSREHAVWALQDYGFRAVIAPSFGDIFRNNALKGGLLPVVLPDKVIDELWVLLEEQPGVELTVDLVARAVRGPGLAPRSAPPSREHRSERASEERTEGGGLWEHEFSLDDHSSWRLLEGLDDIGLTLRHADAIAAFEATRPAYKPVVA